MFIIILILLCTCLGVETYFLNDALEVQEETIEYVNDLYESEKANIKTVVAEPNVYIVANKYYGVDMVLLQAIERHESSNYTSDLYKNNKNTWGAKNSDGSFKTFDSYDESTMELARCLKYGYIKYGLDTIEEIATVYCPDDVDEWVKDVKMLYEEISGIYY